MKYGLKQKYIDQISSVLSTYPSVDKVLLYGSRAKGTYYQGSDIDLTFFGNSIELSLLMKIENRLDDLLLPYYIDASIFDNIEDQDLRDHINRVGVLFYEKKNYQKQHI
ncbi:MAG: nucleotidyltransferase domain-containing protein [Aureispira sp.]